GERGSHIGGAKADQVGVLAERFLVLGGVGTGGGRALGQDDDEDRRRGAEQHGALVQAKARCLQVRQARGTGPTTATPWLARPAARLTMIAPTTAIRPPGIRRVIRRAVTMITMTAPDSAAVAGCTCGSAVAVCRSTPTVRVPTCGTPSMSGSCPAATAMPTPARKPSSTVRDRKFARNPSLASRASTSSVPVSRATKPASWMYLADPGCARPIRAAARMAAEAESAPTARWREEPRTANAAIGRSSVYRPVTTGIPAILAYPRTSGMPRAARV